MFLFSRLNELWGRLARRLPQEELDEEIQAHLQIEIDEKIEEGMTPEDARYAAQRKFGNSLFYKELSEDIWRFAWLDSLIWDIRYALRGLRNSPGFAVTVIGTLALGLGALAASYSVFNTMVLRPFSVRDPYSLYSFTSWKSAKGESLAKWSFTWSEFLDFRRENPVFSEIVGYEYGLASVAGKRANIQAVTGNYFTMLGGRICMGRSLLERDNESGPGVAVASYAAWEARFGADPGIVGTRIRIGAQSVEVAGIACPEFSGPQIQKIDFWVSLPLSRELVGDVGVRGLGNLNGRPLDNPRLKAIGRLKPGLTEASAEKALLAYGRNHYQTWRGWSRPPDSADIQQQATIIPLDSQSVGFFVPFFLLFGLVLLVACANVSNMMLARGLARRRELGIRIALGAGRARMIRQLLTESLMLAVPAALAAYGAAYVIIRMVYWMVSSILPGFMVDFIISDFNVPSFSPDVRVLAFVFITALSTTLVFGLIPAIQTTRSGLFRADRGNYEGGRRPARLRNTLVVVQATLCTLLLILSGVAMRNQMRTASLNLNLDTQGVFLIETHEKYRRPVLDRLSSLPGIEWIGTCASPPLYYPSSYRPRIVGEGGTVEIACAANWVSRSYFDIYKIAVRGRKHSAKMMDFSKGPPDGTEVVVSETAARRLWPSGDALGRTIEEKRVDEKSGRITISRYPIVGIAADSVYELVNLASTPNPQRQAVVYFLGLPTEKNAIFGTIIVRTKGNPNLGRIALQKALEESTPGETHFRIASARDEWDANRWPYLALAAITGFLGTLALFMTMSGVFGMLSYVITQRRKEFGIRIALGADKVRVIAMVLRQSLRLAAMGSILGSLIAFGATRVLASQFYLFSASGYIAGLVVVLVASLIASWIPARRAMDLDPARTLHCD